MARSVLLFGGTSETGPLAEGLAAQGAKVLVSTATDVTLFIGDHPRISRRCGRLSTEAMVALIGAEAVDLVVVATHPYAAEVRAAAIEAGRLSSVPVLVYDRPAAPLWGERIVGAADHDDAAEQAVALARGRAVLLTIGSRNVAAYVQPAQKAGVSLYARVLPVADSTTACREAGLAASHILAARGPFSTEATVETIERYHIGVLVTKESGKAGGLPEKLAAAEQTGCTVIVVTRPASTVGIDSIDGLLEAAASIL